MLAKKKEARFLSLLLAGLLAFSLLGCGSSGGDRKAQEEAEKEEQRQLLQEAQPSLPALPTKDAAGNDFTDLPRPPKSFRISSDLKQEGGQTYGTVQYVSTASLEELKSFYQKELTAKGFKSTRTLEQSIRGLPGGLLGFESGEVRVDVEIEEGKTQKNEKFYYVRLKRFAKL
jgi:hypothetical protein